MGVRRADGVRARAACLLLLAATSCGRFGFDRVDEIDLDDLEPATFATPDDAKAWAGMSAPGLIMIAVVPAAVAGANVTISGETCPVQTMDATTTTFTGGCTDMMGREWIGTVVVIEEVDDTGAYIYDGFGFSGTQDCQGTTYPTLLTIDGSLTMTRSGSLGRFEIEISESSAAVAETDCVATADRVGVRYSGTILPTGVDANADGKLDDNIYNGSGMVGIESVGVASAQTRDELVSGATCADEAASGSTTFTASGHSMVVTYDGAADCDPESTVTWTFDGVDQGELAGVDCSAGRSGPFTLIWIGVAVLWAMRRRTPR